MLEKDGGEWGVAIAPGPFSPGEALYLLEQDMGETGDRRGRAKGTVRTFERTRSSAGSRGETRRKALDRWGGIVR